MVDSVMLWTLSHQSISTYFHPSFPVPPGREVGYGANYRRDISKTVEDRG